MIFLFSTTEQSRPVVCIARIPEKASLGANQNLELLNLLDTEFGWLFRRISEYQLTNDAEKNLPPRLRQMLNWLLTKLSEKEIAVRASLSQFTVHEYTKQLYRILRVTSRIELMARYIDRQP